ncbi:hypothetical protein COLO4_22823 [Corchorus olitorius]|uniref:alpha,alpha-trehalose-phosphate synthase (UDP-forming) n=1 Tax=Corchorus olitorius TaxID=93759 RepID=A0A1R3IJN4_9ROSI|nr:hypothetical protein COLO4_22823 [Corchorus olitorius]
MPGNKYNCSPGPGTPRTRLERLLRERELRKFNKSLNDGDTELSSNDPFSPDSENSTCFNDEESLDSISAGRNSFDGSKQRLLVVANRLPVSAVRRGEDSWHLEISVGGLVSALLGVKEFETRWIGWAGVNVPDEIGQKALTKALAEKRCIPVFLDEEIVHQYYNGYCNNILWPLFHYLGLPQEDRLATTRSFQSQFDAYKKANQMFADVVNQHYEEGDVVWCHDYHLMFLPKCLKERNSKMKVGWFLHTPFPSSEIHRTLPSRSELLRSVLAADLVGFHTYDYARHFVSACTRILGLEGTPEGVEDQGKLTRVAAVMLGVDRLDMIKGIPQKILAFEKFLEENPSWRDKVVLLQIAVPTRTDVPEYQKLTSQVHEIVGRINGRFGTLTADRSLDFHALCALYAVTGAAQSLGAGAILVNPWNITEVASSIGYALNMPADEREKRHHHNFMHVTTHTSQEWAATFGFNATLTEPVDILGRKGSQIKELELKLRPDVQVPLKKLCDDPNTTIVVLSGSDRSIMDDNFGDYNLWLAAENGMFLRVTSGDWMTTMPENLNMDWVDSVKHLWTGPISNASLDVVQGSRSVEVRAVGVTKGAAIDRILGEIVHNKGMKEPIDYVLCIGHFLAKDEDIYTFFEPELPAEAAAPLRPQVPTPARTSVSKLAVSKSASSKSAARFKKQRSMSAIERNTSYPVVAGGLQCSMVPERTSLHEGSSVLDLQGLKERNGISWDSSKMGGKDLLAKAGYGKDVIIGVLDSGVWPESTSFSDEGMEPVPQSWKGICQEGVAFNSSHCNKKIIGARYYVKGFEHIYGKVNASEDYVSPRDMDGHGTHTASTVAGRQVPGVAALGGFAKGTASGGAPMARLAIYKVCWAKPNVTKASGNICPFEDMLKGLDDAIGDGVHVISISIGVDSPLQYEDDVLAIGALNAAKHNIVVVCSAGNRGPTPATLSNTAPWLTTVAASSLDRAFLAPIKLGNGWKIMGQTVSDNKLGNQMYPLIKAEDAVLPHVLQNEKGQCLPNSLDPNMVKGKIVVCWRGTGTRVGKGIEVKRAGGAGFILANSKSNGNELAVDSHLLPATAVTYKDGIKIVEYMNSTQKPMAIINPARTVMHYKPAPFMTAFSARGPNVVDLNILKPDITAPGLNILAAWSEASSPTKLAEDPRRVKYNFESGTSMSCPHVSAAAALIRAIHPKWSFSAIRSAIMTTAQTTNNLGEEITDDSGNAATPFQYGAGHFQPIKAADPGLIYDASFHDYLLYLCSVGQTKLLDRTFKCPEHPPSTVNLNYPSFAIPNLNGTFTIWRTVTNVGRSKSTYLFHSKPPPGVHVKASPNILHFNRLGQKKSFKITVSPADFDSTVPRSNYGFATENHYTVVTIVNIRAIQKLDAQNSK